MPFKPGDPKPQGSGRKKQTGKREAVAAICERLGCEPIEGMVRIANNPKAKLELRARMLAEIAQYMYPKLRAIEHSGPGGGPMEVNVSGTEMLARRIDSLAERLGTAPDSGIAD